MHRFISIWFGAFLCCLVACGFAPASKNNTPNDTTLLSARIPNPRLIGDASAPVKIIEFSDYQ